MATEGNEQPPAETERADGLAELRAVIAQARAGDTSVLPRLRAILDGNPALVRHYGDLARHAESAWITLAAGNNLYMRETATRAAEERREELTRPGAQAIEKLLVERAVACWLQLNYLSSTEANALAAGDTYRQLQYHAKRVERAQRMHLAALGALLTFQRLTPLTGQTLQAHGPAITRAVSDRQAQAEPAAVDPPRVPQPIVEEDELAEERTEERVPIRIAVGG